jgi:16S rRNA (cytosine967-C5)-methyltransferase
MVHEPNVWHARILALHVLVACRRRRDVFVQELLDQALREHPLDGPDRRLATELVYGVLRRRGTLDHLLRPSMQRKPHQVEPWLWEALRLGAYQLLFLDQVPPHAALYETVELAAEVGVFRAKGFINGVLRAILPLLTSERTAAPAADAVPLGGGTYRKLARPVFEEPASSPGAYFAAAFSMPLWLTVRWLARHDFAEVVRLGFWFAEAPPTWLRVNPLRTDRSTLLAKLHAAGVAAEAGDHPQAIRLRDFVPVRELPGFGEGEFVVQDESAMRVASALAPTAGSKVLDLCAAPGGKTTHLAELMAGQGTIFACDVDVRRLGQLAETSRRLGISIIKSRVLALDEDPPAGPFDFVLVDVPCSNTGVLGRRPEARWRLKPDDIRHLGGLPAALLSRGCERVRPGGAIVYSTCSIEPEENRGVVDVVLRDRPDLQFEAEHQSVPGRPADGGYWARLQRR